MLRKGMFLADRYEIIEQVGTGGMSDVYKAKCHKLNRYVAIKVLKKEFSEDKTFVVKFREEAQSAAGLINPNIVNVYDVGEEEGIHYIVMELVEGISLKKYIEKRGRIPYKEAVSIAIQVAKGMEAAHNHHIVHRDIKPQNIIISRDGKVKVTDFGIAKAATSSTINSSAMGSVHYISPEQARGGYSDERSDIYSFGITMYEMITGSVPFDGETTVSVAVQHIQEEIPNISSIIEDIPVSVDRIIAKCTQKKIDMRYQSASELIEDLKKSLVMPDEDFVTIEAAYHTAGLTAGSMETDTQEDEAVPGYDPDDILNDDDDDDELYEEAVHVKSKEKHESKKSLYDDEDESDGKIDAAIKWIGIAIIALIIIITIVLAVSLFGKGKTENPNDTSAVTTETSSKSNINQVEVPDVIGKTEEEAKKLLNQKGLGYKASNQSSATVTAGTVMQQNIKGGTMVDKNSTVILTISIGPESVTIPNLTGYLQKEATEALEAMGLAVDIIKEEYSDLYVAGKVIRVEPESNTQVAPGTKVTMYVSKGKERVTVPKLVGLNKDTALKLLTDQGLTGKVQEVSDSLAPYGQVFNQNYDAETQLEKGSEVIIYVSSNKGTGSGTGTGTGTGTGSGTGTGTGSGTGTGTGTGTGSGTGTGTGTGTGSGTGTGAGDNSDSSGNQGAASDSGSTGN